ncbi:MAG: DegT/DnrJ/EryC1/StrS family aminotransferase, partial [Phaeodactylibacter sp.]|nr:DegT/DnrJ/EryC1/StrS family aminotransferase [Phaeodactylibacter sp.]
MPFNIPLLTGAEAGYLDQVLKAGYFAGDGSFTRACQQQLKTLTGSRAVLLTTSCTHALEMAALLCNIQPGDEVILPSFTFVSTANAFAL